MSASPKTPRGEATDPCNNTSQRLTCPWLLMVTDLTLEQCCTTRTSTFSYIHVFFATETPWKSEIISSFTVNLPKLAGVTFAQLHSWTNCPWKYYNHQAKLHVSFHMKITSAAAWSIWNIRNDCIFNGIIPSLYRCRRLLKEELNLVFHRAKRKNYHAFQTWIDSFR